MTGKQRWDDIARDAGLPAVIDRWLMLAPSAVGSLVDVCTHHGLLHGRCAGLSSSGGLRVVVDGRTHEVEVGELIPGKEAMVSLKAIRGTRDILPGEVERWQRVESAARETFALYGFRELRTPIFEDSAVFLKGTGEATDIVQKEMYRFEDLGGNDLTLRPEGTPPVIRAYLEHGLGQGLSMDRFYYVGPMFRYERPQKGRYRQFHQIGGRGARLGVAAR